MSLRAPATSRWSSRTTPSIRTWPSGRTWSSRSDSVAGPRRKSDAAVSAVAAAMEVAGLLERKPRELAAGEAQHVAIGRAVVRNAPTVFLLDDALSHLDARQRLEGRAELARLHQESGATIISVTHDQAEALAVGTRVAVMDEGRLHQVAPPRTLYERPADVFVAGFMGSPAMNLIEMTVELDGDHPVLRAGSFVLPAPDSAVASLAPRRDGWHPSRGHPGGSWPPDGETAFRARCDLVEYLGHQVLAHLRVGERGAAGLRRREPGTSGRGTSSKAPSRSTTCTCSTAEPVVRSRARSPPVAP